MSILRSLGRALRDRRSFFVVAAVVGLLPLLLALTADAEHRAATRLGLARLFVAGLFAIAVCRQGARWVRESFDPGDEPVGDLPAATAGQLVAVRLAAALATILGSALLAGSPTALALLTTGGGQHPFLFDLFRLDGSPPDFVWLRYHHHLPIRFSDAQWHLWQAGWPLLLFLPFVLFQALSFGFLGGRRQQWLDQAAWLSFLAGFGFAFYRLAHYGVVGILLGWLPLLGLALALLGIAAAWRAFAAEAPAEAHRRHGAFLNSGLLALGAGLAVGAVAVIRPDFAALSSYTWVAANDDGSLWLLGGPQEGSRLEPLFLIEREGRDATYLAPISQVTGAPELTEQGADLHLTGPGGGFARLHAEPGAPPRRSPAAPFEIAAEEPPAGSASREILAEFPQSKIFAADGRFLVEQPASGALRLGRRFATIDRRGACTGGFELPQEAYVGGEIRPGLLLAGVPGSNIDAGNSWIALAEFQRQRGSRAFADWTTLLIETRTGRLLGRRAHFAPNHRFAGGRHAFLLGPWGEPYDLDSADDEPRRMLPWRPRGAANGGG